MTQRGAEKGHVRQGPTICFQVSFLPKKLQGTVSMALDCQNGKPHIAVASMLEKMITLQQVTCAVVNCEVNAPSKGGDSSLLAWQHDPKYMPRVALGFWLVGSSWRVSRHP